MFSKAAFQKGGLFFKKQTTWEETLYQLLGVKQYCKFLIWVKLHYDRLRGKPDTDNYFLRGGSLEDLQFLRGQLIKNAKIHGFGTAICLFCALIAGRFWVILLALLVGMHNLYCVLVQRMNLLRLDRLLQRRAAKENGAFYPTTKQQL